MLDLLLVFFLGFLGSFGHCVGMCSPIALGLSLTDSQREPGSFWQSLVFHGWLNLGRVLSYGLVGAGIGAIGSVLLAGGQLAGVGSVLRQGITIGSGLLLIWFGLAQIGPQLMPQLPLLHPLLQSGIHTRLSAAMTRLSFSRTWWTPIALGLVWGLIPCGFLYAAQIKAAESGNLWGGTATMLAFGLGTVPAMGAMGVLAARLSADRRSQLYRLGGWITLSVGILTLLRTDSMSDYSGHGSLLLLMLALIARPLSRLWAGLMQYRRALGVGAFVLAVIHLLQMLQHALEWNLAAIAFMLPPHQVGMITGMISLALMTPAALTSFDQLQQRLRHWRKIHLLGVPALLLAAFHAILLGGPYLGDLVFTWDHQIRTGILVAAVLLVLLLRARWVWSLFHLERFYGSAHVSTKKELPES